eukprot:192253_1
MGLLTEYPYICKISQLLCKNQNYRGLIKILKVVIDRHSKKLLAMKHDELNIFIEILNELIRVLHAESTIPLDQEFENSVLCQYIKMVQLILHQPTLSKMISNQLKVKLSVMTIAIYFDYSRFKQCEGIIHDTIQLAQTSLCHYQVIKLVIMRCSYVAFTSIDGDTSTKAVQSVQELDQMIQNIRTFHDKTKTNNEQKATEHDDANNAKMPPICDLFLRLLQVALRMRFDQSVEAGKLLIESTDCLVKYISKKEEPHVGSAGRKRKLSEIGDCENTVYERPSKRRRLSLENDVFVNHNKSDVIMDSDVCFLVHFCALMHLIWIVRNSAFENEKMDQMRHSMGPLLARNALDVEEKDMTFFERSLMQFFTAKTEESETMRNVETLCWRINGREFKRQIIPLLHRVNPHYNDRNGVSYAQSVLLQHMDWLHNVPSLSVVLEMLFNCLEAMHGGNIKDALTYIELIKWEEIEHARTDFGTLHLKLIVWSIKRHLALCQHDDINANMMDIFRMMRHNDAISKLLKEEYCEQELFENYCRNIETKKKSKKKKKKDVEKQSKMVLASGEALIVFDETENEMKLQSLEAPCDDTSAPLKWMESIPRAIKNGDIYALDQFKSFLRLSAIKLHYLSSHVALILHDRKCTRNQVKRVHRLTLKNVDVSSRFYIRLMLEVLRHGTFSPSNSENAAPKDQEKQIKSIFNYIRMIFSQNKNTNNVLPFVALCVIYAYCTVKDDVIVAFNSKNDKTKQDPIKRRITFLKFMMNQLFASATPTQGCYLHIISPVIVYLYKLMHKCKDYDQQKEKMKQFLAQWLPQQWRFINDQLPKCTPIKRITAHSIQSFDGSAHSIPKQPDYALTIDPAIKKLILNYYDHIYVAKPSKN